MFINYYIYIYSDSVFVAQLAERSATQAGCIWDTSRAQAPSGPLK